MRDRRTHGAFHGQRFIRMGVAVCLSFAAAICGEVARAAGDSEFPRKPIKVVVPFGAGGDSDTFARIIQKAVRNHALLPQPLVILNVPGAGGTVGSRRVRDAAPDGYTVLNLHEGILSSKYAGRVPYGSEAFRAIAATGRSSLVICVRDDAPFLDLDGLMTVATDKPDSVLFGMAHGTPTHFAGLRLEETGGAVRFRFVASGGGARRFNDLVGGHIDVTPFSLAEYLGFKAAGIRAVAYLGTERHPSLPELPTARELGYDVVMPHVHYWWAPRSTPDTAVQRIAEALRAAMSTDYVLGKLSESKTEPLFLSGAALEAHLERREAEFQGVALVRYEHLPDPVPWVVGLTLALATVIAVRSAFVGPRTSDSPGAWRHGFLTLAVIAAYVLAMQLAGTPHLAATMVFFPVLGVASGARAPKTIARLAIAGIVLAAACHVLFTRVLVIDLP